MKPSSPQTLTWGTATTAVASALMLVAVGCIVPAAQREASGGFDDSVERSRLKRHAPAPAARPHAPPRHATQRAVSRP